MPVEIRELIIRATATEASGGGPPVSPEPSGTNTEAIVAACVRQVLKILQVSKER